MQRTRAMDTTQCSMKSKQLLLTGSMTHFPMTRSIIFTIITTNSIINIIIVIISGCKSQTTVIARRVRHVREDGRWDPPLQSKPPDFLLLNYLDIFQISVSWISSFLAILIIRSVFQPYFSRSSTWLPQIQSMSG